MILGVGTAVAFPAEDLRIAISAVREDSRCPPTVTCVWEGMATVAAWAQKGSEPRQELILATNDRVALRRERGLGGLRPEADRVRSCNRLATGAS